MTPRRLSRLIAHDARLQWRYGIYGAYAVVIALYAAGLAHAGQHLPAWAPGLIIFTDPAALAFFFLGALVMLERSERVRTALATTPIGPREYFAAKAATLTALALVACVVLFQFLHGPGNLALLLAAVALTSLQFVGIGVPIALRFKTVNGYLVGSVAFLAPVIAPGFLALLDPTPAWALLVPAVSQLKLMLVATGGASATPEEIGGMLAVSTAAAAAGTWLALRALDREFGVR